MNPIDLLFQQLRPQRRKAFIPFMTAGDPNLDATASIVHALANQGADLIEIGFPYSDPIADGSVIQASYTRALQQGIKVDDIFAWTRVLAATAPFARGSIPLVGMVSYSLVHHRGPERFLNQAREAGFSGAIVPDLPIEEAETLAALAAAADFKLIQLVTPTTPRHRALRIAKASTGFLYCVSVIGITGERSQLPPELLDQLVWLRQQTDLPLCVGFGISTPTHVHMLRNQADGLIVGSALVRKLENTNSLSLKATIQEISLLAHSLSTTLNPND